MKVYFYTGKAAIAHPYFIHNFKVCAEILQRTQILWDVNPCLWIIGFRGFEGCTFLQIVDSHSSNKTTSYSRLPESSTFQWRSYNHHHLYRHRLRIFTALTSCQYTRLRRIYCHHHTSYVTSSTLWNHLYVRLKEMWGIWHNLWSLVAARFINYDWDEEQNTDDDCNNEKVKIKTTVSETGRIYHEGEGGKEEEEDQQEEKEEGEKKNCWCRKNNNRG